MKTSWLWLSVCETFARESNSWLLHFSLWGAALLGVVSILPNWSNISSPIIFCCLSVSWSPSSQLTNNLGLNSGNLFVLFVFMSSWLPTLLLLGQSTHLFMALSLRTFIPPVSSVLGKSKSYSFLMEANSQ